MKKELEKALDNGPEEVSGEQLERINRHTRRRLEAGEVYVFSLVLCDNEVDRDLEQFSPEALEALGRLFVGKTGVFDHAPRAENQTARIFEAKVAAGEERNSLGQPYRALKAWAYMLRNEKNAGLIQEIDGGIKKEVSVGCAVNRVVCSICGKEQGGEICGHEKGASYGGRVCHHILDGVSDAYEWSFVAVPAQRRAGVVKRMGGRPDGEELPGSSGRLEELEQECRRLQKLAAVGKSHLEGLRRQVVKLALLAQPDLDGTVMERAVERLEEGELLAMEKSYRRAAGMLYPVGLQLGPAGDERREPDRRFQV